MSSLGRARRVAPSSGDASSLPARQLELTSGAVEPRVATRRASTHDGCAWCGASLAGLRRDARFCSTRCRQASHRFGSHVGCGLPAGEPRRLAYADPPYPRRARLYRGHPDYAGEVDHRALLRELVAFDGWALSTAGDSLHELLDLCTAEGIRPRVAVWMRGARPGESYGARCGWEAVLYVPARVVLSRDHVEDVLTGTPRARTTDPARVVGAKPPWFSDWLFGLLVARAGDDLHDLFPGSGGVARAWELWCGRAAGPGLDRPGVYPGSFPDPGADQSGGPGDAPRSPAPSGGRP